MAPHNTALIRSVKNRDEVGALAASVDKAEYAIGKVTIDIRALKAAVAEKNLAADVKSLPPRWFPRKTGRYGGV